MLSDGIIVLYWIPITIILISIGQLTSFTTAFPKSRSGLQRRSSIVRASKNEIERPANFIDEKNMEQSLFNPPPRSKKMMNQRGVITDVEDVVVNLPLGEHFGSTFDKTHTLPLFSTSTKSSTMYRSTYTLMWLSISIIVPFTVVALTDVEDCFTEYFHDFIYDDAIKPNGTRPAEGEPPVYVDQASIDEKALRATPIGKLLFGILDKVFPVFKEPNWFDVYDPPLSSEQNLELPYFDGFDFVNSSWTVYIRHRYGVWNWLDRIGVVPPVTTRVFIRGDGITMWSDGFYGDWYINPAINYIQIEKHFGRGYGYTQYSRGIRIFQVQKWNFEHEVGRYWNRGLRSYLRNETNYWALEGRVWGTAVKWRPYPRDQGKFIAIRDGTNLTEIFGEGETPWEKRFKHSMSLPFYQAHPDQLERIEDNFDYFYRNLLGRKIR